MEFIRGNKNEKKGKVERSGHAYSLIDIIYLAKTKKYYIKLRNSQVGLKVFKQITNE